MIQMDNVGIVVEDMDAAVAFFTELGLELEGRTQVEGAWADKTVGIDGIRCEIAMMRVPGGHGRLELSDSPGLGAALDREALARFEENAARARRVVS